MHSFFVGRIDFHSRAYCLSGGMTAIPFNPETPKSDYDLISPYNITAESGDDRK